ncbi:MAG TPA: hypothetical protein VGB53_11765 [Rubricoccaceae bacterium]|jgi:hypothetical protein
MRRFASVSLVLAAASLTACAGSAPVAVAPPPPPRPAAQPVRPPLPPPPAPAAVVVPPAAPPQAPRGTVQTRTYYAEADVTEWVLTNGATVVFKPLPNEGRVDLLGATVTTDPGRATSCEVQRRSSREAGSLAGLFEAGLGRRAVYVAVGDARPGEVEQAAARLLTLPDTPPPCESVRAAGPEFSASVPLEADATAAVLVELLIARGQRPVLQRDAGTGSTTLRGIPEADVLRTLRPTAAALGAARTAAAARLAESPAFWADALAALYLADGDLRPSRDPAFVARFPSRVARVSAESVAALAARFAASSSN